MRRGLWILLALLLPVLAACGQTAQESTEEAEPDAFAPVTAVDNEVCAITITGVDEDSKLGYALQAELENKSADQTYVYAVEGAAVDGVICDVVFQAEVAAGEKASTEISLTDPALTENGITGYTDIALTFRVYSVVKDQETQVARETVHVYPKGESEATAFVREAQPEDQVLVDDDNISVLVIGSADDEIWGHTAKLFLVNKTDHAVTFQAEQVTVNGQEADPSYSDLVPPGKCKFSSMSWSNLAQKKIKKVKEIAFVLSAYETAHPKAGQLFRQAVKFAPVVKAAPEAEASAEGASDEAEQPKEDAAKSGADADGQKTADAA